MNAETIVNLKISLTTKTEKIYIDSSNFNDIIEHLDKKLITVEIAGTSYIFYPDNRNKTTIMKMKMRLDYIKIIEVVELDDMLVFKINDGISFRLKEYQDIHLFKMFYERVWMLM